MKIGDKIVVIAGRHTGKGGIVLGYEYYKQVVSVKGVVNKQENLIYMCNIDGIGVKINSRHLKKITEPIKKQPEKTDKIFEVLEGLKNLVEDVLIKVEEKN